MNLEVPSHNFDIKFNEIFESNLNSEKSNTSQDIKSIINILSENVNEANKNLLDSIDVSDNIVDTINNNKFFEMFYHTKKGGQVTEDDSESNSESKSESKSESESESELQSLSISSNNSESKNNNTEIENNNTEIKSDNFLNTNENVFVGKRFLGKEKKNGNVEKVNKRTLHTGLTDMSDSESELLSLSDSTENRKSLSEIFTKNYKKEGKISKKKSKFTQNKQNNQGNKVASFLGASKNDMMPQQMGNNLINYEDLYKQGKLNNYTNSYSPEDNAGLSDTLNKYNNENTNNMGINGLDSLPPNVRNELLKSNSLMSIQDPNQMMAQQMMQQQMMPQQMMPQQMMPQMMPMQNNLKAGNTNDLLNGMNMIGGNQNLELSMNPNMMTQQMMPQQMMPQQMMPQQMMPQQMMPQMMPQMMQQQMLPQLNDNQIKSILDRYGKGYNGPVELQGGSAKMPKLNKKQIKYILKKYGSKKKKN